MTTIKELTSSQRKFLRSQGRTHRPDVTVGKCGVTEGVIAHIRSQFALQELLKIRLPASDAAGRAEDAEKIVAGTGAVIVDVVGRIAVLYLPNRRLAEDKRITLPD